MPQRILLILTLVCSSLHAQDVWKLEPMVVHNAVVSDLPDRRVLEIGETWSVGDELVFWGRVGDAKDAWALLSWKRGLLRTIATDGEKVKPRYAVPSIETLQHVHHATGFHPAVRIVAAGGRLYLTTGTNRGASTYAWTSGRLEPVLLEGDSFPFGNVTYTVAAAEMVDTSRDGAPLLRVETSQPHRTILLAAKVGTRIVPLLEEKVPIPRLGFRATFSGIPQRGETVHLMRSGNLLLQATTEDRGTAVIEVTGARATKLLATGDPVPGGKEIIERLKLLDAGGADSYIVNVNLAPYICAGTRCRRIEVPLPAGMEIGVLVRGGFISSDAQRAAFVVGMLRRVADEKQLTGSQIDYRFDLLYFDGTKAHLPSASMSRGVGAGTRLRAVPGFHVMLFEEFSLEEERAWRQGRPLHGAWELDVATGKLAPVRSFQTEPRRNVTLRNVFAHRDPDVFIVRLDDGLYSMRR